MRGCGSDQPTLFLHERIDVLAWHCILSSSLDRVWGLVVSDIVDLPFVQEGLVDDPGRVGHNFVYPAAVPQELTALDLGELGPAERVSEDADHQMH